MQAWALKQEMRTQRKDAARVRFLTRGISSLAETRARQVHKMGQRLDKTMATMRRQTGLIFHDFMNSEFVSSKIQRRKTRPPPFFDRRQRSMCGFGYGGLRHVKVKDEKTLERKMTEETV